MTREEAIQILADLIDSPFLHTWEEQCKALHMAIEALSAEADISEYADRLWKIAYERGKAESEARTGEWVRKYDDKVNCYWYECDQCGEYRPRNQFGHEYNANYCPNCGAEMRGEEE